MTEAVINETLMAAGLDEVGDWSESRALEIERQYWREHITCQISLLINALENGNKILCRLKGPVKAPKSVLLELLGQARQSLIDALKGDYYLRCEGCGGYIWTDDVQIPYSDVSMHANCDGSGKIKAGDQIPVDPDSIDDTDLEPGEAKPTHVTAFVAGPLFSDEQIRERLAKATTILLSAGGL